MFLRKTSMLKIMRRFLNLHEYQASEILSHYNLPIPIGNPAETPTEAFEIANKIM